jgi:hypothetical protein
MATNMSQIKATATAHMRREMEGGGEWVCGCEACHSFRSLIGVEKVLAVRPLVRAIQEAEQRLEGLPDGPERQSLLEQYLALHDDLADFMAK